MKLGEALTRKKEIEDEITRLQNLAEDYFWYDDKPKISISQVITEIKKLQKERRELQSAIVNANQSNTISVEGRTLTITEAVLFKQELSDAYRLYRSFLNQRSLFSSEEKNKPQIPLDEIETVVRELRERIAKLDTQLQAFNWNYEL